MKKRALIIGINNYRSVSPLRGCVNDTTNLRLILREFAGFESQELRLLVDARATKVAIEKRLQWLVDEAEAGDLLVFHFSGHGSQIRDRDEADELVDRLDEILCPWDMDWEETFINDDYLMQHLRVPEGVVLEVILDSCNSGDASVEIGFPSPVATADLATADLTNPERVPRFLQPPVDIVSRHQGASVPRRRLFESRVPGRLAMWSACADFQTAADARIGGIPQGAFTFYFCKHLRESQGRASRAELLRQVRASLAHAGYTQVPELAAPAEFLASAPFSGPATGRRGAR